MASTSIKKYREGEVIVCQGGSDRNLYRVMAGAVLFFVNYGAPDELVVGAVGMLGYFGAMNVLTGSPSEVTVVAQKNTTILCIPEEVFGDYIKSDYRNALSIMKSMAQDSSFMRMLIDQFRINDEAGVAAAFRQVMERLYPLQEPPPYEPEQAEFSQPEEPAQQEAVPEDPPPQETLALYLPGHKGYPGITHPEYKSHLFQKEMVCPHCREKFTTPRIFHSDPTLTAAAPPDSERYDFRVHYQDFEAEWYEVLTCPHCYFSALESAFTNVKYLKKQLYSSNLQDACSAVWLDFTAERNLDFVFAQHYLALICASGFSDHRQLTAHLWSNLRRLYATIEDPYLERQAEEKALEAQKKVYMECELSPVQLQRICLQIASTLYRLGDRRSALDWAVKVRARRDGKDGYIKLAERLIGDVNAELKKA